MPPRRKSTKIGSLAAEDSGIASSDKSQGKGAAGNEAATLGAAAGRTRRQTTRTQSKTANKSASVDADLATATEKTGEPRQFFGYRSDPLGSGEPRRLDARER
jgi:hypothetical protein